MAAAVSPTARLGMYTLSALAIAALVVSTIVLEPSAGLIFALLMSLAPAALFGFIGLAARYPCRALPIRSTSLLVLIATHLGAAVVVSAVWGVAWRSWLQTLETFGVRQAAGIAGSTTTLLFATGILLYLGAVIAQYLIAEIETSAADRQSALRYQLLAREAELKAFKSQIDPHFLFNSLNAISSLCGSSPEAARTMSQQLADFFRRSLRLGLRERISLGEEFELAESYLAIERTRFGSRLQTSVSIDPGAAAWMVPPMLLQPLVENAVRHGIASIVEGGAVELDAALSGRRLRIVIANPADPDRPPARGEGIGLANVRGRLAAVYDDAATLRATESDGRFRVEIAIEAAES